MTRRNSVSRAHFCNTSKQTLNDAIGGYEWACKLEHLSPCTISKNVATLRRFQWFCEENHFPDRFSELNSGPIKTFLLYVQTNPRRWGKDERTPPACKPVKASTVGRYRTILHSFWEWAIEREQIVDTNPADAVRAIKTESRLIEGLSSEQVRRLIDACCKNKNPHWRRDLAIVLV